MSQAWVRRMAYRQQKALLDLLMDEFERNAAEIGVLVGDKLKNHKNGDAD